MVYLDDLKDFKLYKKKIFLPIDKKDKKHGSAILLLTPDYSSSNSIMNHPLIVNRNKSFAGYYLEKDIMYTIQNESRALEIDHMDYTQMINEQPSIFTETTDMKCFDDLRESCINELYCRLGDKMIFFNELYDESIFNEVVKNKYSSRYKTLLYNDRIRNNKEVFRIYSTVKTDNPWITMAYVNLDRYRKFNIFVDLYFYNKVFLENNNFTVRRSLDMYFEFIKRFINDKRITNAGYTKRTVFVPIDSWNIKKNTEIFDYKANLNPLSVFYNKLRFSYTDLNVFKDITFVFFGNTGYFKITPENIEQRDYFKFARNIKYLSTNQPVDDSDTKDNSPDGIATSIIDKLETNSGIVIHNLTGSDTESSNEKDKLKNQLTKKIIDASKNADSEDEAINNMEEDEDIKRIISDLQDQSDRSINITPTRANRINKAKDELMKKKLDSKSISDLINNANKPVELPVKQLPIKSINEEWKQLQAVNFEAVYDLDADIVKCLNSLSSLDKSYPISILDISKEDTSTTEDSVFTYTVKCEDYQGKRFTLKFDIPKFRDNRFMRLGGNEKIFSMELPLLPITKTDSDTAQIVTFYNKIFVYAYTSSSATSNLYVSNTIKAFEKYQNNELKGIEFNPGDNRLISAKYNLPIDYIDLGNFYDSIKFTTTINNKEQQVTVYFNQDEIRNKYKINDSLGIPFMVAKDGTIIYYDRSTNETFIDVLLTYIHDDDFWKFFRAATPPKKCAYSNAKIFNTNIPVIVILAHDLGLTKALELAGVTYNISDKKSKELTYDSIKLADGYLNYHMTYESMMLVNGLKTCDTEAINIASINNKKTWIEQLDNFGGRVKSDGLDNFADLMYDPITVEISKDYDLPDNYHEALIYASNLLIDNKYYMHTDLTSNRVRTNEVVAAQFYKAMASAYVDYTMQQRRGRQAVMYIPKNAVINLIMQQNTTSDLSVFQPLLEIETKNMISTKGVAGMNSERAYKLDKRGYDKSMVNIIAQATSFTNTVGVNRQTTINPSIIGGRGYIKPNSDVDQMSVTNTLCMTEALSPFMVTSDDVFRNDMTFVQTSKHSTPIDYGTPLLVTTGADSAMPYLSSNMFAHKAKKSGTVSAITEDYMVVDYNDGTKEYVNLAEQTMKNSDGGFYITLKLKTDLKVGTKVKEDTILAYDNKSFSNRIGHKQVSYNVGCLTKVCILTSDDGYEDSGVCSEFLSEAMASDIVVMKQVNLPAMCNVLYIANKGQEIHEGEPILIFQNAYDEEDANLLLKNLNNDDGDVSEIGRNTIKSKVTGVLSDIKIYRTVELDELSESLKKIVTDKEKKINSYKKIAAKASNEVLFDPTEKLPQAGKLKNTEGVYIEFFMRYHDKMSVGDKMSSNANKTVLMKVYPDKDAPYTDFRPNEKIDMCNSCSALDGRMITSVIKVGLLNKLMIELSRTVDDIMGIPWKTMHEMYFEDMKNNN